MFSRWPKYKIIYFGRGRASNLPVEDEFQRHALKPLNAFEELDVVLSPELNHHAQVYAAVTKARTVAFLIRWVFRHLPTKVFLRTYTRKQVWSPAMLGDMAKIENVKRMTTRLVPALRILPYELRPAILGLFHMQIRVDPAYLLPLDRHANGAGSRLFHSSHGMDDC